MADPNPQDFNTAVIEDFRAHEGQVGGYFAGKPVLLLTTTGARTGRRLTSPLMYNTDGDRVLVFASKGGAPTQPSWYHNLLANPRVTVELGSETFAATAVEVTGEERDRLYDKQGIEFPQFADYQRKTDRKIPVIALERVG